MQMPRVTLQNDLHRETYLNIFGEPKEETKS